MHRVSQWPEPLITVPRGNTRLHPPEWFPFLLLFFKKAPKFYGFKEALEKHECPLCTLGEARTSLPGPPGRAPPDPPLRTSVPPLLPRAGPGVKAILSHGPGRDRVMATLGQPVEANPPAPHGHRPDLRPALVQYCGSERASPLVEETTASPCDTPALGLPPRENGLWMGDKLDFMS